VSNLENRLTKLEEKQPGNKTVVRIIRTVVDCSGKTPIGYRCGDIEVFKQDDESKEDLDVRLFNAVDWPIGDNYRHIFHPIYADNDNVII